MKACDLFSLGPKEIKEYLEGYDIKAEFSRERGKVYPTTKEEKIFGLEGYMKDPKTTGRKIIKKFPIVKLTPSDKYTDTYLSISMGNKLIIVIFSSDFKVVQIDTGGDSVWTFEN